MTDIKIKIYGIVKGGKFIPSDVEKFKKAFYRYEGKKIFLTIETEKKTRSSQQNRYYWAVIVEIISEHTGYNLDEVNDLLKWKFNRLHRDGLPDSCKSFKALDTVEFEDKMSKIREWAAIELSLYIPLPNETKF